MNRIYCSIGKRQVFLSPALTVLIGNPKKIEVGYTSDVVVLHPTTSKKGFVTSKYRGGLVVKDRKFIDFLSLLSGGDSRVEGFYDGINNVIFLKPKEDV